MSERPVQLAGPSGPVRIERDATGVAHITGSDVNGVHFGLGFCHARDRGLQMLLVRILGRGTACEKLRSSDEMLALDKFFRRMDFGRDASTEEAAFTPRARAAVNAYAAGVNHYFSTAKIPWELRLMGVSFESWTPSDVLLTAKVIGYITLAQSQSEMERFIIECVQNGIPRAQLEELFPGQLHGLDEEAVGKIRLGERIVPAELKWASALPRAMASNNWVVAGRKTASGQPLLCNDPHLEVNRLPPVWYEAVLRWTTPAGPRYAIGGTMPGVPGVIIGRNPDLAWGVTYAFMDCTDSWIEDCRDGKFRRGENWFPFTIRKEIIRRKKKPPVEISFYDNDHGTLDGDPSSTGCYLATRWSCGEKTGAASLDAVCEILDARTVEDGRNILGRLANCSWNWVLADRSGSIGYQMAGRMPQRRAGVSGLVPLPGWDAANDWQGFVPPEKLPRLLNPPEGFIATANDDLNFLSASRPINLPMAAYRAERIRAVLAEERKFTVGDMQRLHFDCQSTQAGRFLALLKPLLSGMPAECAESARLLADWDGNYQSESRGAFVFEQTYRALIEEVFGHESPTTFGRTVLTRLLNDTCLFFDFYGNFDRILLAEKSAWFGGRSRDEMYRAALLKALRVPPEPYGHRQKVLMKHLLLGGKLPAWLGFDRAVELRGSRATVHQGQIYRGTGRETTFAPSLRFITDLGTDEMHTTLPGGASDRRFSKWYANGIEDWLAGRYKVLSGKPGAT